MGVRSNQLPVSSLQTKQLLLLIFGLLASLVTACSGAKSGTITRIALLAPFEGRYREVGYDAYYAVKLAMQDHGNPSIELLAADDGGTVESASARAKALAGDPLVSAVIALGYAAAHPETQSALDSTPMLIVGQWGARPERDSVFMLSSPSLQTMFPTIYEITSAAHLNEPIRGGEALALKQIPLLTDHTELLTIYSSASLADVRFSERYLSSGEFAPEPGLLATLTYDATRIALEAITSNEDVWANIQATDYEGINGRIRFAEGYWVDAPVHCYGYDNSETLTAKDCVVEER